MRPLIGISGSIIIDQGGRFPGYDRAYVNNDYVQSVLRAEGIPFILPVLEDDEAVKAQAQAMDGLILSGGHDVQSLLYQEEPLPKQGSPFPERDHSEGVLAVEMIRQGKPVFAICRGVQLLNAVYGGSMYQDTSYMKGNILKHDQVHTPAQATHTIQTEPESFMREHFGTTTLTNSFHHQAIKTVAPGFKATAYAADGVIEAIEMEDTTAFVIGVQWHPEMMTKKHERMQRLFDHFVNQASLTKQPTP
ncbi:gamma-glutamyl-gamma-aminobutyrate hydrolase family protein [Halobacillus sp. ACCC02827]|uniref:gamma-glutamyl-gamma-aminobutyrate hydrolase family protein n=1 Tax=Bacillaceae TaxID=186817 RepID=UPI0004202E0F|nr:MULTISPECIES: gamma-glutamyl-gamma-aminobutyrate hydrolase family protein [Bacillaceae]QHT45612.1 gamma-glutamyl-gamma-aminobutyrate hydrolase family protein [Bacillus sp. SB49]WJE16409.1 gamma-glutamyl-gamma-aminobutyrate hydrolase family protein [Halobacillus sp. ACCC02827]